MATPPRSAAERSLRPPSRRPIGVRAPATMTDPDMSASCERARRTDARDDTHRGRRREAVRVRPVSDRSHRVAAGHAPYDDDPMTRPPLDIPEHLFTAIDHVGIAVPDLDEAIAFYRDDLRHAGRPRGDQRGAGRPRGDDGRRRLRLVHPAAGPARRPSRRSRSSSTAPARASSSWPTGSTDVEQVAAILRERGLRLLYDAPRRGTSDSPGQLHPPQGRRRRARRAGRTRRRRTETSITSGRHRGYSPVSSGRIDRSTRPRRRTRRRHVQHILDAILAGDTTAEDFASLDAPRVLPRRRPSTRTRSTCSRAWPARDKDPRKSLHVEDVALPELGPGEALVAVMASAINYNTVWTSIFEPVSTFGFLERYGRISPLTKRHDLPYHVVGSDLAGVVLKTGAGRAHLEARRRGRRALPLGRAGEPRRPQRHDARPRAADLGLRDQLRRPGRHRAGQVQPADAQARPPDLGGGRLPRPGQLHGLPPAGQPATAPT